MQISVVLLGRTVPGFKDLIEAIRENFKARVSMEVADFPMTRSFRSARQQYDADVLLSELSRTADPDAVTLFVIREDMFSPPMNFVFGLAKGNAGIVSTARLDPRFYGEPEDMKAAGALFKERLVKEAMHELGHAFGLPHCPDRMCVMVFSDSIAGVDFKGKAFCARCRKALYL